jgi:F-type H+-transporting ATPase subunit b
MAMCNNYRTRKMWRRTFAAAVLLAVTVFCLHALAAGEAPAQERPGAVGRVVGSDAWRVVWTWANFLLIVVVVYKLAAKPLLSFLDRKIEEIKNAVSASRSREEAARASFDEIEERLAHVADDKGHIGKRAESIGDVARKRILADADAVCARLDEQNAQATEREYAAARDSVRRRVLESSMKRAETMLRAQLSDDDQQTLIDRFIERLETMEIEA